MSEPNSAFPYRGDYQPPDRAGEYQPASVVVRAAVRPDGTIVAQAQAAMIHAQREHVKYLDTLKEHRERYSDKGFIEQKQLFASTEAAQAVGEALAAVQQRRDQAQTHVERLRKDLSPHGDTADELRAGRYWARTKAILDNADAGVVSQAARDFISKADRSELGVLATELESYLESRGCQASGWMDAALAAAAPELARAQAEFTKADQALAITKHNAAKLMQGFNEGRPPEVIIDPSKYDPDAG